MLGGTILSDVPLCKKFDNITLLNDINKLGKELFEDSDRLKSFKEYSFSNKKKYINRCYFKLYEINSMFNYQVFSKHTNEKQIVLDICGGPGGFAKCLLDFVDDIEVYGFSKIFPNNSANSNLNYKQILNMRKFINIQTRNNCLIKDINELVSCIIPQECHSLVLADGCSIIDDNTEESHLEIIKHEIHLILHATKVGGNAVIKFFNIDRDETVAELYRLYCNFDNVFAVKPFTSTSYNDEMYIVCFSKKPSTQEVDKDVFHKKVRLIRNNKLYKKHSAFLELKFQLENNEDISVYTERVSKMIKLQFNADEMKFNKEYMKLKIA